MATNTPVELNSKINVDEDKKNLGLKWDPRLDGFFVNSEKPVLLQKLTKRIALSLISKIFDLLGFFTPFLIRAKIVFQSLFCISKAPVAQVKTETLPRLELTACVLGCRMSKFVTHTLAKGDIATFFLTDSKICLGWFNQGVQKFKAYVGNRVKKF